LFVSSGFEMVFLSLPFRLKPVPYGVLLHQKHRVAHVFSCPTRKISSARDAIKGVDDAAMAG
jgi:hypothetical protein